MNQLTHPLIIVAQAILGFGAFRLFFSIRESKAPLPQFIGLLGIAILSNLTARIKSYEWFFITDIVQYCLFAGVVITAFYSVKHVQAVEAKKPGAVIVAPDFLDRWQNRFMWVIGILFGGLVVYAYSTTYLQQEKVSAEVTNTAVQVYAQATKEYSENQAKNTQVQDSILTAIASLSATQTTILANQSATQKTVEQTNKKVDKSAAEVKRTIRNTVIDARPIDPQKPKIQTTPNEKPTFWQRLFKSAHVPDSVYKVPAPFYASADTTYSQYLGGSPNEQDSTDTETMHVWGKAVKTPYKSRHAGKRVLLPYIKGKRSGDTLVFYNSL